jgi:hypothetical protein
MIMRILIPIIWIASFAVHAQEFKVEYDKNRDYSQYKTFRFGEGELTTPKDQRQVTAEEVDKWVKNAVTKELEMKGLKRVDSAADLVVSYLAGSIAKSVASNVGPMGLTPGSMERNFSREYQVGNLVIDLNDRKGLKVWRISATIEMLSNNAPTVIDGVVQKGFKKYPKPAKKKKK